MKHALAILCVLSVLIAPTAAVYDPNDTRNTSDGEMHIMTRGSAGTSGSSSASASTAVGPTGTEWRATVSMQGAACANGNASDAIANISHGMSEDEPDWHRSTFSGTVLTPTPCHTLDHEVTETGPNTYALNITSSAGDGVCVECVGVVEYEASFSAPQYNVTVYHDGERIDAFTSVNYGEQTGNNDDTPGDGDNGGFFAGIVSFLAGLF